MATTSRVIVMVTAMLIIPILAFGQEKEIRTGEDGFQYYKLTDRQTSNWRYKIEDLDGNTLVPWQPEGYSIVYLATTGQYFCVYKSCKSINYIDKKNDSFLSLAFYSREGEKLFDCTPYDYATMSRLDDGRYYFKVYKDKKCAILDGGGNIIVPYDKREPFFSEKTFKYTIKDGKWGKGGYIPGKFEDTGIGLADTYKLKVYPNVSSKSEARNDLASAKTSTSTTAKEDHKSTTSSNSNIANAQNLSIQKTWLEHNVMNNGCKNMVINVYLKADNMRGQNINVNAYVDETQGVGHKDTNGKYKDSSGNVVASTTVNATYQYSEWKDLRIFLPNDEIHPLSGQHDYYIRVFAFGPNGSRTNGEYVKFSMTGSSQTPKAAVSNASTQARRGTTNGHEWVDLGLPSKTLWATCNVGASSPTENGSYFAWGETKPKSVYDWSTYKWCKGTEKSMTKYCTFSDHGVVDNRKELELSDDAAYVNWGSGWRMPSKAQIDELSEECLWTWTTKNGTAGYIGMGPNGNSIFLPATGGRHNSSLNAVGSMGYFWSRTLDLDSSGAYFLGLISKLGVSTKPMFRDLGLTVRPVRDK